ncbi:Glycosyltransferase involved in cell wall bisynthesis [Streptomyces radiopugnans]|uniref:D-inositol 3-phosphate glycosyltransferase n=1 Tax=Streptomyces radiopugnans TaxID=403935 RepID=A0A1H9DWB4_9ACTN|nr:Glycosyltransferase involved in cell wall bisynthesis [Streptomyces radiopugnans]
MLDSFKDRCVLVVSTNYAPEHAGIGPYSAQIAEHLAALGADTHVLAGMPHYPAWRVHEEYRGRWRVREVREGVTVHRRRHTVPRRQTALRRGLFEASVLAHGIAAPPRVRPDVVLSQMPSLAGGVLGARIARRAGAPHAVVVQDLMGAAAGQSGMSGGGRVASFAGGVEGRVLRSAALVGVVHESFADRVAAMGVPRERVRVVPNWTHVRAPGGDRARTRARLGWPEDATVVLHSGNMGLKQGLEVLVETARLAGRDGGPGSGSGSGGTVRVVLMGEGHRRGHLREMARGVESLDFLPPADAEEFPEILAAADVLAVTQRASVLDMSLPSKLTSYFTAGRPVVASVAAGSGTAREVERSGAGVVVPPEDPEALLGAVRRLAGDPGRCAELGARGREYVERRLSRRAGLERITALLREASAAG